MGRNVARGEMSHGEPSRGETSFGEKRRTCANFGKKWGEMIFGEKRRREKCRGEKRHLGRNVFPPFKMQRFQMELKQIQLYCTKPANGRVSLPKKVSLVLLLFNNRIALVGKEAESSKCGRIQSKDLRISGPCVHLNPVLFVLKYFSSYLNIIF